MTPGDTRHGFSALGPVFEVPPSLWPRIAAEFPVSSEFALSYVVINSLVSPTSRSLQLKDDHGKKSPAVMRSSTSDCKQKDYIHL